MMFTIILCIIMLHIHIINIRIYMICSIYSVQIMYLLYLMCSDCRQHNRYDCEKKDKPSINAVFQNAEFYHGSLIIAFIVHMFV